MMASRAPGLAGRFGACWRAIIEPCHINTLMFFFLITTFGNHAQTVALDLRVPALDPGASSMVNLS